MRATGAAGVINQAFGVQLRLYPATATVSAGPYRLRANDRPVTLPASLAPGVLGVTGLDNAAQASTLVRPGAQPAGRAPRTGAAAARTAPCSHYYGQHFATGLPRHYGRSTFPTQVCGYSARQLRAAYGASSANTGQGQTIALVALGLVPQMFRILRTYAAVSGLPAPSAQRYTERSVGRGSACGDFFDVEEQMDVEAAYDMAPGAHELVMSGDSCDDGDFGAQGLYDAEIAILNGAGNRPLASIASNSWESGEETQPSSDIGIEHAFLVRAAAEGVGMYFSSGDGSGVWAPSSDPFAISVGGTTVGIGKTSNRLFETRWSTGQNLVIHKKWTIFGELGAAGGGPSLLWKEPEYQSGVVPASMTEAPGNRGNPARSVPDISADADVYTGMAVGLLKSHQGKPPAFGFTVVAGTSLAAPLVAGMVTAAQQGQRAPFGFLNPVLYQLPGTGALRDVLPLTASSNSLFRGVACDARVCGQQLLTTFDDQSPTMLYYFGQVTVPGYDNMTGLGTPDGQRFIEVLRRLER